MSAVLRHVVKYRPNWTIDLQAEEGRHCIGRGIAANHFEFGKNPNPDKVYDAEVEILLFDTWANWGDRPNTRVSSCLRDRFGLDWDPQCARYRIDVRPEVTEQIRRVWTSFVPQLRYKDASLNKRVVAVHYKGDSSPAQKDLSDVQASIICDYIIQMGLVPLLLDWRGVSPLRVRGDYGNTGRMYNSRWWGADAEYNCAVIRECDAFVGIDSGPSKCASSTDVPSLVIWTGHHPAIFHDPALNTTHLVPHNYHGLKPVCNNHGVIDFFEKNYLVRTYGRDPVIEVKKWLEEALG
jgi:hypothetical protein